MAGQNSTTAGASPLFLRDAEIRRGGELLFFGYSRMTRAIDEQLVEQGLGRAHHRALYFISRHPHLTVGNLLRMLLVTKQSLGRVLGDLTERGYIETRQGQDDRRQKLLRLSDAGTVLEARLFESMKERIGAAYAHAGQHAVTGFWQVLEGLIPPEDRDLIGDLNRRG
ncbi:MarR family transcriptional regulator [Sphingomonas sp.]|uniref:MarR family winged helix-turn-helix transcriptional regulator n=1 Tax=Sphingomonas sp. TaxID=28214 RepID=UPI0025DF814F|nr:MarR family transcriptional regulator [Sphingomonas sp.]